MRYVLVMVVPLASGAGLAAALLLPWFAGGYGAALFLVLPAFVITGHLFVSRLARRASHRRFQRDGVPTRAVVTGVRPLEREVNDAAGRPVTLRVTEPSGHPRTVEDTSGLGGYQVRKGDRLTGRWSAAASPPFRPEGIVAAGATRPLARGEGSPPVLGSTVGLAVTAAVLAFVILEPTMARDGDPHATFTGLLFTALGAFFLWLGLHKPIRILLLRGRTTGTVTHVWSETVGIADKKTLHSLAVRFTTPDGRAVHRRYPDTVYTPVDKGRPIDVRYAPSHPADFELPTLQSRPLHWTGALVGAASTAFGLWALAAS